MAMLKKNRREADRLKQQAFARKKQAIADKEKEADKQRAQKQAAAAAQRAAQVQQNRQYFEDVHNLINGAKDNIAEAYLRSADTHSRIAQAQALTAIAELMYDQKRTVDMQP